MCAIRVQCSAHGKELTRASMALKPAKRICSLLPSATEIIGRLGLADRLVCVTHECDVAPHKDVLDTLIASGKVSRVTSSAINPDIYTQVWKVRPALLYCAAISSFRIITTGQPQTSPWRACRMHPRMHTRCNSAIVKLHRAAGIAIPAPRAAHAAVLHAVTTDRREADTVRCSH